MTDDTREIADAIEHWFRSHDGDGEFSIAEPGSRLFCDGALDEASTVVYCTKPRCRSRVSLPSQLAEPVVVVGRDGLPRFGELDAQWGAGDCQRFFVGDADPVDLLIFAWLRALWPIRMLGVCDEFLRSHGNLDNQAIQIPLSKSECAAISQLPRLCPDYRTLVGDYCSSLLDDGFKIELEGACASRPR